MTVIYRLEPTGRTPHETVERLLTTACPACGADWTIRGNGLPRGPHRCYLCSTCKRIFDAQLVDEHDRSVASPGWGLAQELREREEGPDHP